MSSCFLTPGTSETRERAMGGYSIVRRWQMKGLETGPPPSSQKGPQKNCRMSGGFREGRSKTLMRSGSRNTPQNVPEHYPHVIENVFWGGGPLFSKARKFLWLSQLWKRELCQGGRAGILVNWPTGDFLWVQFLHLVESSYFLLCVAVVFVDFVTYFDCFL